MHRREELPRVAHVLRKLDGSAWGGTETHVAAVTSTLARRGASSVVLAPSTATGGEVRFAVPVERFRAHCPYLGSSTAREGLVANAGNLLSFEAPWRLWRDRSIDLAHVHTQGRIGGAVRWAMQKTGRPYVVSLHGPKLAHPELLAEDHARRTAGTVDVGQPFGALVGSRRVLDDAARVICFHEDERRALAARIGDRAVRMDHGVDRARFASGHAWRAQRRFPALGEGPVVLLVGRLSRQKNQALAIAAFARSAPADARLVFAGAATDDVEQELRDQARAVGVAQRVLFLGNVEPEAIPDLLARASLVIMPSLHEAFGLVVLEAWAAARPVLFANLAGLADLGRSVGTPEVAIDGHDVAVWGDALSGALASLDRRRAWAAAGHALVRERYGWDAVAARLLDLYRDVLTERALAA